MCLGMYTFACVGVCVWGGVWVCVGVWVYVFAHGSVWGCGCPSSHSIGLCWYGELLEVDVERVICFLQQHLVDHVQLAGDGRRLGEKRATVKECAEYNSHHS